MLIIQSKKLNILKELIRSQSKNKQWEKLVFAQSSVNTREKSAYFFCYVLLTVLQSFNFKFWQETFNKENNKKVFSWTSHPRAVHRTHIWVLSIWETLFRWEYIVYPKVYPCHLLRTSCLRNVVCLGNKTLLLNKSSQAVGQHRSVGDIAMKLYINKSLS